MPMSAGTQLRFWWKQHGSPKEFCAIYNNGKHLFLYDKAPPGEFICEQMFFWRHTQPFVSVANATITLVHRGHILGVLGGDAFVVASASALWNTCLVVKPLHLLYVIKVGGKGKLQSLSLPRPLPNYLLPLF